MKLSHFIVCTDAGLASNENRAFNNIQNRSYIVTYRILKTEFKSRLVYLKNDDRIKVHFTTCFLSLLIYRILENKLDYKFSISKIISTLQSMNSLKIDGLGYKQIFESSTIVNALCDLLDVQLNTDFISNKNMKKIINKL